VTRSAIPLPADKEAAMTAPAPRPSTSPTPAAFNPSRRHEADLVVLSHLRWSWVWQRPQHLVSRFAARRAAGGAQTWFVEEPVHGDVDHPELRTEQVDGLTRACLVLPRDPAAGDHPGFDAPGADAYGALLAAALHEAGVREPEVLLYTPMALDVAEELSPSRLHYDVMDDLASFLGAPEGLVLRQRRALQEADVVFAGGRSLYRSVNQHRTGPCHLFPSGVETTHYARSRALRGPHERPVAGYVGVIDERVDLHLLAELAAELPDWTIRVVGPVAKIDEADLPLADNLEFPGMARYEDLPEVMAGFDVALMPFALNAATRSISPTKTLEYLAAGLPVVSTRVADVVVDYGSVVHFADDGPAFAAAARHVIAQARTERDRKVRRISADHEWDVIAERMSELMTAGTAEAVTQAQA
jgi:glycosyltransferase involved in cell wall biosynthesis